MDESLNNFPLTSVAFVAVLLVGAFLVVTGSLSYEEWLKYTGIATPGFAAVGGVRVLDKWRKQTNGDI